MEQPIRLLDDMVVSVRYNIIIIIFSQKQDTSDHTGGRKTTKATDFSCSSLRSRRTGSRRCSTERARPVTPPPGYPHAILTLPPRPTRNPLVSKIPQSSLSWDSPANSATNLTMNIQLPYIPDLIYNSTDQLTHLHTTYPKYRPQIPKDLKGMALETTGWIWKYYRRGQKCLRGLSLVLWRDIEKCVEDLRRK